MVPLTIRIQLYQAHRLSLLGCKINNPMAECNKIGTDLAQ